MHVFYFTLKFMISDRYKRLGYQSRTSFDTAIPRGARACSGPVGLYGVHG